MGSLTAQRTGGTHSLSSCLGHLDEGRTLLLPLFMSVIWYSISAGSKSITLPMYQCLLFTAATYVPFGYGSVPVVSIKSLSGMGPFDAASGSTARDIPSPTESASRTCGAYSSTSGVEAWAGVGGRWNTLHPSQLGWNAPLLKQLEQKHDVFLTAISPWFSVTTLWMARVPLICFVFIWSNSFLASSHLDLDTKSYLIWLCSWFFLHLKKNLQHSVWSQFDVKQQNLPSFLLCHQPRHMGLYRAQPQNIARMPLSLFLMVCSHIHCILISILRRRRVSHMVNTCYVWVFTGWFSS